MADSLKTLYLEKVVPKLKEEFGYTNPHQIPKLAKVTVNRGLGEASNNAKALESSISELAMITGQRPVVTRAKKAIAGFKIREGMPVGVKVTLRSDRMYAFANRLINLTLPRIRDFRGVSPRSFDGRGNYTLACASSSFSQRLITTALTKFAVWTSPLSPRRTPTKKAEPF